ncbi:hypothetical protein BJ878DRAFT_490500 [Calycina marina]|uniref:peptidylprolyl isomerase n=1 Tax=Calycina marina TaxID=1763456 RepID=A0A9P7Z9I5_9HELO|nr:hypothetical protein BJ878DRAFT_490500 [Calycina marina]
MPLLPVAVYGLEVPSGDIMVPAIADFPATFRITMAAIDPSQKPEFADGADVSVTPRATLKILRQPVEEDDEDDEDYMQALMGGSDSEDNSDESSNESDVGASGGSKDGASKKARKEAALKQLMESLAADDDESDEEMGGATNGINGVSKSKKGKGKNTSLDDSDDESDDGEDVEIEEFVLCTLDPEKNFQQPIDITIAENEAVYFKVSGTHTVYLTGNYVIPDDAGHNRHHEVYDSDSEDDEEDEYDLSPDEDELDLSLMEDDASDDLDDLENPRVTELESEDDAPKLTKKEEKKGKNKRTADELEAAATPSSLDDIISKSIKADGGEEKLSKKQMKKLKKNNGEATPVEKKEEIITPAKSDKSDKKVQFAKNLEQGPTGSAEKPKKDAPATPAKSALGVRKVNGVTVDDKKIGSGPACKKGNKVEMRYIGKLVDGKVFDSNKKGKAFMFKLGLGEVIKGWDIGVTGMQVGGERRLTIPASLAYGSKAMPGLPANSTLIFDIKLLSIK